MKRRLLLAFKRSTRLSRLLSSTGGSASVEFSLLAIPLFIPIFIYMSNFAHASDLQDSMRTLARESARAFVLSNNDETAFRVSQQVFLGGGQVLGSGSDIRNNLIVMDIQCTEKPCITPNAKVEVQIRVVKSGERTITVSAVEYVSPWS